MIKQLMCENAICGLSQVRYWPLISTPQKPTLKEFNFRVINQKNGHVVKQTDAGSCRYKLKWDWLALFIYISLKKKMFCTTPSIVFLHSNEPNKVWKHSCNISVYSQRLAGSAEGAPPGIVHICWCDILVHVFL